MSSRRRNLVFALEALESRESLTLVPPLLVAANTFLTPDPVVTTSPWAPNPDILGPLIGPAGPGAAQNLQDQFQQATAISTPFVALPVGQLD